MGAGHGVGHMLGPMGVGHGETDELHPHASCGQIQRQLQ